MVKRPPRESLIGVAAVSVVACCRPRGLPLCTGEAFQGDEKRTPSERRFSCMRRTARHRTVLPRHGDTSEGKQIAGRGSKLSTPQSHRASALF